MPDLESRLRRLEDRAELQDLVVRYFIASDDDDFETLEACFAPEGAFWASGFGGGSGREVVLDTLRAGRNAMGPTVHTPDYTLFAFEGEDVATGQVGAHLELSLGGKTLFGAVRYTDRYVRRQGAWCILSREMRVIHMGPWDEVGNSLTREFNVCWPGLDPLRSDFPKRY